MTPELLGAGRLRALLASHGVRPTKSLGQNFVIDPNTIRKVVQVATIAPGDHVLEIGAGAGSLTLGLVAAGARVTAVELDQRLLPVLTEAVAGLDAVEIVEADALRMDHGAFSATQLVGNLPYNIAATIVIKALQEAPHLRSLTVMTQREVGERLAASPGSKSYGQPSVIVGFFATARVATRISRNAFYPVPNVDSVVVRIDRRAEVPDVDRRLFSEVVRHAFAQRRKTLRRSLASLLEGVEAEALFATAGVAPGARAEAIDVDGFVALTRAFQGAERAPSDPL
ncbi:MAG TPA: 16S rRNA (adenine(1518)-N(6)/adenine(1519)-N(6))-dimethyltransferase RsmA [Actinomycetota bacterium]|nr:16S rRNA (adenine(1518)-N(6)/adenine(1519)-N(6))-dimethyltransferase RsmA [Actinomycetota bacterium]